MQKAERTKIHILECAFALFQQRQFDDVKITEICKEARIAASTFYTHFKTKEALVIELYVYYTQFSPEDYEQILKESSPWEQLWKAHCIYCEKMEYLGKDLCLQLYKTRSGLTLINEKGGLVLEPLMQRAQEAEYILNKTNPETMYVCSCYLVRGVYYAWCTAEQTFDLRKELRKALEVYYDLAQELRTETRLIYSETK